MGTGDDENTGAVRVGRSTMFSLAQIPVPCRRKAGLGWEGLGWAGQSRAGLG